LRELEDPPTLKAGAVERNDLDDEFPELFPEPPLRLPSFLSRGIVIGADHSLSVAGVPTDSSRSSTELPPPPLVEADPDIKLREEELPLRSFSLPFSFSSNPMNMRDRASL
jgi:hypothetical protein